MKKGATKLKSIVLFLLVLLLLGAPGYGQSPKVLENNGKTPVPESVPIVQKLLNIAESINVRKMVDSKSAGWAYKLSDNLFAVELDDCSIKWNVVEYKERPGEYNLYKSGECSYPFFEQLPIHRAILINIFNEIPPAKTKSLGMGSFGNKQANDWSWNIPIALASVSSEDWEDYRNNYPNCKKKARCVSTNELFVRFAKANNVYKDLKDLFREHGLNVELNSVEKVFAQYPAKVPFADQIEKYNIPDNVRLIYDCGMSWFTLEPKR